MSIWPYGHGAQGKRVEAKPQMAIQRLQVLIHSLAQLTVEVGIEQENLFPRYTSIHKLFADHIAAACSDHDKIVDARLEHIRGKNPMSRGHLSMLAWVVVAQANNLDMIG